MKLLRKITFSFLMLFSIIFFDGHIAEAGIIKGVGSLYITLTNPVEWLTSSWVVEEQHIVPQFMDANQIKSVVLISRFNHTVSDRWKSKPYLSTAHSSGLGKLVLSIITLGGSHAQEQLNAAYRLGCYVTPYALFSYDYRHDEWHILASELNAPAMIVYGVSWLINLPQKYMNKIAYICQRGSEPSILTLLDLIPNLLGTIFIDVPCAVIGTTIGTIIAFLCNPIDSILSIFGMCYFLIFSVWTAVADFVSGVFYLCTGLF